MSAAAQGMGAKARWPAPAKLNLFLHVLGRRADGRHELETVFQLLDFGDDLDFQLRDDGQLHLRSTLPGLAAEDDLCFRAARLLQRETGCSQGVEIDCRKRIPTGGGLGGGSSDAATCLVALNALWGTGLSSQDLADLGLSLGADVPVFVRGRSAFAQGVGERLQPQALPERWYCVVTPDCEVSTAAVFKAPELTRNSSPVTISNLLAEIEAGRNDCWPVVASRYPAVADAQQRLSAFGAARMSGTGASVYLSCDSRAQALQAAQAMPDFWHVFVARGLNHSPLWEMANEHTTGV